MMKELFEKGYKIIVGSPYGDLEMQDMADIENYCNDKYDAVDVNHDDKTAYFYTGIWA